MKNPKNYVSYILDIDEEVLNEALTKGKYYTFKLPKRSGGYRTIASPDWNLKKVQEKIKEYIDKKYTFLECQYGFIKGKNIVDNAIIHSKAGYILNIDLKDFFPSIHFGRGRGIFMNQPFNLPKEVATILANLSCFHNALPQGSPASPSLSNIVCYSLDKKILHLSEQYQFHYTRYADDITLSSPTLFSEKIVKRNHDNEVILGQELRKLIERSGFTINETKTNYSWQRERKEVTGLIVNEKVNVKKIYIKKLRALLNHCEKEGLYATALNYFKKDEKDDCQNIHKNKLIKELKKVIEGRLNFIAMVRGKEDLVLKKYQNQYLEILKKNRK